MSLPAGARRITVAVSDDPTFARSAEGSAERRVETGLRLSVRIRELLSGAREVRLR